MNSHIAPASTGVSTPSVVIPASADRADDHPARRQRARAVAVGPDPGQRRGDQHPDRHRRELDAGRDRVVALDALEVEDEHEQQREARQAVDERRRGRGREHAVLEDRRGRASARGWRRSISTKSGSSTTPTTSPAIVSGSSQPSSPAARDAVDEAGEADHERDRAQEVEAAHACRARTSSRRIERGPERAERRANGTLNQNTQCQEIVDERAAEHRPDHEADARRPSCWCPSRGRAARAGTRR